MSDFDTDIDTGVEDFDTTESTESVTDRQGDATDAIAQMLATGDTSYVDNFDGDAGDAFKMGHVRSGDGERQGGPKDDSSYMDAARSNQGMPDLESPGKRINYYEHMAGHIQSEYADLEQRFANGEISQADFMYQREFLQGKSAAAMINHQQAQIEQMENQRWMDSQVSAVRDKHRDVFDDPVKRDAYARRGIEMLGKIGYSDAELKDIGAREYNFLIDHLKMQDRLQELEVQNKMLVKEKRERQRSLGRAQRSNEVGARTKDTAAQQDEIMRVLFGGK